MAVAFQTMIHLFGNGTNGAGTEPTGTVQDDLLYAQYVVTQTASAPTPPAGWTALRSGQSGTAAGNSFWYWRGWIKRGASAPALTWTHGGASTYRELLIMRINGQDLTNPISADATPVVSSAANPDCPAVTPVDNDCLIIADATNWAGSGGSGWGAPASYTIRSNNTAGNDLVAATRVLAGGASAAENPAAFTGGLASAEQVSYTVAIRPAVAGGGAAAATTAIIVPNQAVMASSGWW